MLAVIVAAQLAGIDAEGFTSWTSDMDAACLEARACESKSRSTCGQQPSGSYYHKNPDVCVADIFLSCMHGKGFLRGPAAAGGAAGCERRTSDFPAVLPDRPVPLTSAVTGMIALQRWAKKKSVSQEKEFALASSEYGAAKDEFARKELAGRLKVPIETFRRITKSKKTRYLAYMKVSLGEYDFEKQRFPLVLRNETFDPPIPYSTFGTQSLPKELRDYDPAIHAGRRITPVGNGSPRFLAVPPERAKALRDEVGTGSLLLFVTGPVTSVEFEEAKFTLGISPGPAIVLGVRVEDYGLLHFKQHSIERGLFAQHRTRSAVWLTKPMWFFPVGEDVSVECVMHCGG
ncbi:MAG: hypothetical protein AAF654_03615 [Myxococcota bacterium]